MSGEQPGEHPDRFEIAARNWRAQTRIIETGRKVSRALGLDPELVEDMNDAYLASDSEAWDEAVARFLEAWAEAKKEAEQDD